MPETFKKRITVEDNFDPEFFFDRIYTENGIHYHICVVNKGGESFHFTMSEKYGKWKIINAPQPPQWIVNIEKDLGNAIFQSIIR